MWKRWITRRRCIFKAWIRENEPISSEHCSFCNQIGTWKFQLNLSLMLIVHGLLRIISNTHRDWAMSTKQDEVRQIILHTFLQNQKNSYSMIAKTLKLPRSTVKRVLKRYKETSSTERKPWSGTNLVPKNQDLKKKIVRSFQQNPGLSDTDRAKRYGTSKFTVQRIRQKAG